MDILVTLSAWCFRILWGLYLTDIYKNKLYHHQPRYLALNSVFPFPRPVTRDSEWGINRLNEMAQLTESASWRGDGISAVPDHTKLNPSSLQSCTPRSRHLATPADGPGLQHSQETLLCALNVCWGQASQPEIMNQLSRMLCPYPKGIK